MILRHTLFALLSLVPVAPAVAMSTLQDLPAVTIGVRALAPEAEAFGVSREAIIERLGDALAVAGVVLAEPGDARLPAGAPAVEVTVLASRLGSSGHIFTVRLALRESVELRRPTRQLVEVPAVTWEREVLGYSSQPDRVLAAVSTLADRFTAEWRAARRS